MYIYRLCLFIIFLGFSINAFSQARIDTIKSKLSLLENENPGLKNRIDISVNSVSLREFFRSIAITNNLNLTVDPSISHEISANFSDIPVKDVIVYACTQFNLDIRLDGNIVSFIPFVHEYYSKKLNINYSHENSTLGFEFLNDSLILVVKEVSKLSGVNLIYHPTLNNKVVSGFVLSLPFQSALDKLALLNDMKLTQTSDSVLIFEPYESQALSSSQNIKAEKASTNYRKAGTSLTNLKIDEGGGINIDVTNTPISDLVSGISSKLKIDYFLVSELRGNASLNIKNASFEQFLYFVLNGTEYTYKKDSLIYLIGDKKLDALRSTRVLKLNYRTVDKVTDYIPQVISKNLEIVLFTDQNSLVINGAEPDIDILERFIRKIDTVVPVIAIDVMIVDVRKSKTVSTGIEAGIGTQPTTTSGKVFPNLDMSLGAKSINNLIDGLNGFGSINLGKVTPNFYLNLKALEVQGNLDLRSTPKLATLNGHEATLSIGKTEYYLEISNNVIGSQNPQNIITQQYKSVNADLSVVINPIVSGDEQITLEINVKQSSFTERISPSAPPGTISRDFKSLIRVKNEEMILLGGLQEDGINSTGSGVPILSRIPIIKWLFSSRTRGNSTSKLTIFIKPTIIY